MTSKKRIKLSQTQKDAILFDSDFRCCICRDNKKPPQIHHIDGDPANNDSDNLAVLCLEHHSDVSCKGGFGCSWSPELIKKYRNSWLEKVSSQRDKHLQPPLSEVLSDIDMHQSFLDALACHEIIKQDRKICQADWMGKIPLLDDLYIYTSYDYGIPPKAKMMDLLYNLAICACVKMPEEVAKKIEFLALNSLPVTSLVGPAHKAPSEQQINVLMSANCVGRTMAYHATERLKNIKVVAAGAQIMSSVLRYAKLNKLDDLYKLVSNDFKEIIDLAVKIDFQDAQKWLSFMQADALALDGDVLPTMPEDIHRNLMQ